MTVLDKENDAERLPAHPSGDIEQQEAAVSSSKKNAAAKKFQSKDATLGNTTSSFLSTKHMSVTPKDLVWSDVNMKLLDTKSKSKDENGKPPVKLDILKVTRNEVHR